MATFGLILLLNEISFKNKIYSDDNFDNDELRLS